MTKQEAIKKYYKLRNEAYQKVEELNHPDFIYLEETSQWKSKLKLYDDFLNVLMNIYE